MYKRGQTKAPEKSERIEENLKKITGGKKKWVRHDEGAALYSMGIRDLQGCALLRGAGAWRFLLHQP